MEQPYTAGHRGAGEFTPARRRGGDGRNENSNSDDESARSGTARKPLFPALPVATTR